MSTLTMRLKYDKIELSSNKNRKNIGASANCMGLTDDRASRGAISSGYSLL